MVIDNKIRIIIFAFFIGTFIIVFSGLILYKYLNYPANKMSTDPNEI